MIPYFGFAKARGEDTGIELCAPDPAANPYLALAVCLSAGLDGIQNKILPPKPFGGSVMELSSQERETLTIEQLPSTLGNMTEDIPEAGCTSYPAYVLRRPQSPVRAHLHTAVSERL